MVKEILRLRSALKFFRELAKIMAKHAGRVEIV